jgi:hypothetical protein
MSKLSLELQTDLKNKAINLCCDITKLFDEFNSALLHKPICKGFFSDIIFK